MKQLKQTILEIFVDEKAAPHSLTDQEIEDFEKDMRKLDK